MPEPGESKSEKIGLNITPTALEALRFIEKMHPKKYDGAASVLWDYSIEGAIEAHRNASAQVSA